MERLQEAVAGKIDAFFLDWMADYPGAVPLSAVSLRQPGWGDAPSSQIPPSTGPAMPAACRTRPSAQMPASAPTV
jgi:hypothetical protein